MSEDDVVANPGPGPEVPIIEYEHDFMGFDAERGIHHIEAVVLGELRKWYGGMSLQWHVGGGRSDEEWSRVVTLALLKRR